MEFPKSWVFAILRAILALSFRKILEFPLSFWKFLEFWLQKHYILAFLGEIWYINRIYLWYKAKRFPAFSGFLSFFKKNAWVFAKNFLSLSFWALEFLGRRLKKPCINPTIKNGVRIVTIYRTVNTVMGKFSRWWVKQTWLAIGEKETVQVFKVHRLSSWPRIWQF